MSSTPGSVTGTPSRPITNVEHRVVALRELSEHDPAAARDLAWSWFRELSQRAAHDRDAAAADLGALFRCGTPPAELDGQTEGMLITFLTVTPVDLGMRALTGAWMPWLGKRFDHAAGRGDNTMRGDARWPLKLLWPTYETRPHPLGRAAFEFETGIESGKDDPDRLVLKIDYASVPENPMLIRSIRDELVQVIPGANLGKVLFRAGSERYQNIGFFALRSGTG